jgi:hypothetical protein
MEIDTGGPKPAEVFDIGNYTRNVSPMWHKAMTAAAGLEMRIQDTDGMTGAAVLPIFKDALADMAINRSEYEAMSPTNGWGDYQGAKRFILRCIEACEANPRAVIRWSV